MNELKINNINMANAVNAPANEPKIEKEAENTFTNTAKQATEEAKEAVTKHVIVYLGNGEYTDSTGHKWHKNDEYTYSDDEYNSRKDIHFMVKYGEMKHTMVTI